jgi:tetratricopeptide (TPR) repeat protein
MRWITFSALALSAGCAAEKVALSEVASPEVIVETIPSGASVSTQTSAPGTTPYALHARTVEEQHVLTVSRPGFHAQEVRVTGEDVHAHPGARLLVPLRPDLWDANAKAIDPDDAATLAKAGVDLSRANRCPEALLFLGRAAQVNPRLAMSHKAMGSCLARLKKTDQALAAYKQYLLVAPDAPDAERVRAIVSKAAGDIEIPPPFRE